MMWTCEKWKPEIDREKNKEKRKRKRNRGEKRIDKHESDIPNEVKKKNNNYDVIIWVLIWF